MPELTFDRGAFDDALEFARATGAATRIGEAIAQGVIDYLTTSLPSHASPSRDQLAAMAMQGLVADPNVRLASASDFASAARLAHQVAAAMLAERERLSAAHTPQSAPELT